MEGGREGEDMDSPAIPQAQADGGMWGRGGLFGGGSGFPGVPMVPRLGDVLHAQHRRRHREGFHRPRHGAVQGENLHLPPGAFLAPPNLREPENGCYPQAGALVRSQYDPNLGFLAPFWGRFAHPEVALRQRGADGGEAQQGGLHGVVHRGAELGEKAGCTGGGTPPN